MEWEWEETYDPTDFGQRRLKLIEFVSRSAGRGRRRRPREVSFLKVDTYVLPVRNGELRSSGAIGRIRPDELAEELLGNGATTDQLMEVVRRRQRR